LHVITYLLINEDKAAIGVIFPSKTQLPHNISIYTAELIAIT